MFRNNNKTIIEKDLILKQKTLSKDFLKSAIDKAIKQIDLNIEYFGSDLYPTPQTFNNIYTKMDNTEWTNGFWSGIIWLAYEYTKDKKYLEIGQKHVDDYLHRIKNKIEVNHHDMGFLYSLSCVASYKLTKNPKAKEAALLAADNLASRYSKQGKFIQAWGNVSGNDNYRLIIDCLLNIPLLFWASENGGKKEYKEIAINHFNTSLRTVIREDGTTFHTFYFDKETSKPLYGKTRQGYTDDSCWARGQAWGIYGIPLTLKYISNLKLLDKDTLEIYKKVVNQFLNNQGSDDFIAYWDLDLNDDKNHSRDSSASAIAACGLLEMYKLNLLDEPTNLIYTKASNKIIESLINKYALLETKPGSPLLFHGVYSWHTNKGVDQGNIWGDYFYLEALIRLYQDLEIYW
ncbi:glycoside hydrolase family 88 protein [Mycoplasma crocodyli]|uniref:Unsaturated glucuronyl hydrolase (Glucuronidase) Ugl n=1 Tax=Mycoplasma crocodyli (strain ATCC 51981 / MP145) TaxID=512564 RepID=D5E5I9_MYCCM|nr:glycoside hydrolase family 88 protein [Mycoplasma crocodyli]ADE19904.1 unsaturated glucuronyl hydrolase (glucuronidase) Ugl [Mycoplasma crocodyli MP145]